MKNVYVITIFNNNFVIQYDGNNILIFGTSHGKTLDQIESSVCDYIEHELRYYNGNVNELRIFLIKLQSIINLSDKNNIMDNVREFFLKNTNIFFSDENEATIQSDMNSNKISELEKFKEQILNNYNIDNSSEPETIKKGGRQKVLGNGKSLIDNKDAFVNALLLAFIVELFGLTIFNLFLFRII